MEAQTPPGVGGSIAVLQRTSSVQTVTVEPRARTIYLRGEKIVEHLGAARIKQYPSLTQEPILANFSNRPAKLLPFHYF